eukprot:CAMPEP_0206441808 /NCGR_PEP_ID=MMETSP0324_2-20121206/13478_1 /ASSEMBLY_ACC=CAM_ASM_000836 /TAXON_ID=2866 /ORGANISM="Crypthecodinium cohnii, Strain Seligo" /LENGTH=365 /DNA_ID=CAMNT_0053909593 /DNA_START=60 /DNA_END=1157 /DNA_ORIENTATION=-
MATIVGGKGTYMLAASDKEYHMSKVEIGRPACGPDDVSIEIIYCGMCHSDLHSINGDWGSEMFPIAPGHEIGGIVRAVGEKAAANFELGEKVCVGCMVMSCLSCGLCDEGLEQFCTGMCLTYGNMFPAGKGHDDCSKTHTNGGYSSDITIHQRFVFKVPEGMPLEVAGPLCCAGITTYSPLSKHVKGKKDQKVGVVGFGGLGMMAVKIAKAMGAKVTIFSRSKAKQADAEAMGASLVATSDADSLAAAARSLDVIIDTVSDFHDIGQLISTLKPNTGTLVLLGAIAKPLNLPAFGLLFSGTRVEGSLIGGCGQTQEMLEFCHENKIAPSFEIISAKEAEGALHKLHEGAAGAKRFVIKMDTLKQM